MTSTEEISSVNNPYSYVVLVHMTNTIIKNKKKTIVEPTKTFIAVKFKKILFNMHLNMNKLAIKDGLL